MSLQLQSRVIRGRTKDRKISLGRRVQNFVRFLRPVAAIAGGLIRWAFSFLKISIVQIFSLIFEFSITLLNFDWNASDEQLAQIIAANNLQAISSAGVFAGGALGWVVCLGASALAEIKVPILRGRLLVQLTKEAGDQALANLQNLLITTARTASINAVIGTYRNVRRWLLSDSGLGNRVGRFLFGENYEQVRNTWGRSAEPFIISEIIEDSIQSIPSAGLRTFTQSLLDEFADELTDCLFEAVYIIQQAYDDQIAVHDYAYGYDFGAPELAVDVAPDVTSIVPLRASNEIVRITAPNQLVLKHRINETITTAKLFDNRDLGIVIGEPAEDRVTNQPLMRQLVLTFRGQPRPPFRNPDNFPARVVTITIPEPKVGLSWNELKAVCRPYEWGGFMAIAQLDRGRKLKVFAATEAEANQAITRFHSLCTLTILSVSVTEEGFRRNPGLIKRPERIFPEYATLTVRRDNQGLGRNVADGRTLSQEIQHIILWSDSPLPGTPTLL